MAKQPNKPLANDIRELTRYMIEVARRADWEAMNGYPNQLKERTSDMMRLCENILWRVKRNMEEA